MDVNRVVKQANEHDILWRVASDWLLFITIEKFRQDGDLNDGWTSCEPQPVAGYGNIEVSGG